MKGMLKECSRRYSTQQECVGKDEDFHILHLSDLHISGKVLGDRFDIMLNDIEKNTKAIKSLVVVITGDIASKGQVVRSEKAILDFFGRLYDVLKDKIIDIEIVPGNHDYDRRSLISAQTCEEALKQYTSVCLKIYKMFGHSDSKKEIFGEKIVRFGDRSVCFLRMDTSWFLPEDTIEEVINREMDDSGQFDNMDESARRNALIKFINDRKKVISKHVSELDSLLKDKLDSCREKCAKDGFPVAVTFALAHHPLSWLLKTSCERYADFLLRKGFRNIDMWLCGHAHDVQIHFDNDNNQSTVVLMTGVGTEETGKDRHRYSLYKFSLIRNIFAIKVRAALTGGKFENDNSLLPTEISEKRQHFCYPLKTITPGAVIPLNEVKGFDSKEMYVDQTALVLMKGVVERMKALGIVLMDVVRNYVMDCAVELVKINPSFKDKIYSAIYLRNDAIIKSKKWRDFLATNKHRLSKLFQSYFSEICDNVVAVIVMQMENEADVKKTLTFNQDISFWRNNWRAHFRVLAKKKGSKDFDEYKCVAFSGQQNPGSKSLKPVPWRNSQIRKAYEHPRKALVKSANDCENPIDTEWDDFLTTIIDDKRNEIVVGGRRMPILTFGISVKEENYESRYVARRILYLFDFFDLNSIISRAVSEFSNRIGIFFQPDMIME